MALKQAKDIRDGEDYLDLKAVAANEDVLAVFRLIDFLPKTPVEGKKNVYVYPVRCDVLICSGPDAGKAWFNQSLQGNAVSKTLRGAKDGETPTYSLTPEENEITAVIKRPTRDFPIVNAPTSEQHEDAAKFYNSLGGFPEQTESESTRNGTTAASATTTEAPKWRRRS